MHSHFERIAPPWGSKWTPKCTHLHTVMCSFAFEITTLNESHNRILTTSVCSCENSSCCLISVSCFLRAIMKKCLWKLVGPVVVLVDSNGRITLFRLKVSNICIMLCKTVKTENMNWDFHTLVKRIVTPCHVFWFTLSSI